jgi:hypothetical protein
LKGEYRIAVPGTHQTRRGVQSQSENRDKAESRRDSDVLLLSCFRLHEHISHSSISKYRRVESNLDSLLRSFEGDSNPEMTRGVSLGTLVAEESGQQYLVSEYDTIVPRGDGPYVNLLEIRNGAAADLAVDRRQRVETDFYSGSRGVVRILK